MLVLECAERARARVDRAGYHVKGLLNLIGMSLGAWLGWALGAQVSLFTAFVLSFIGTGAGLYLTRIAVTRYLE